MQLYIKAYKHRILSFCLFVVRIFYYCGVYHRLVAQDHTEKASSLLNNSTLDEIREVNNRIADSLKAGLEQLEENVTSLSVRSQVQQIPQDRIPTINGTVM